MPFSGPSSWLATIDEFIGHWTDVNAALSPSVMTLPSGYLIAGLQADRTALAAAITALEGAINVVEGHRTSRDNQEEPILARMRALAAYIRGPLMDSVYVGQIPDLVLRSSSSGLWIKAMDDHQHIWTTINASPPAGFTPPLILPGGHTVAQFGTLVSTLKTTFTNLTQADQDMDREHDERDQIYFRIRDELATYRAMVTGLFAEGHALVLSIPRLVPLPGHTPDPVVLSGAWNALNEKADLSWTASVDPDLASYSVRRSGATPYDASTETAVESVLPGTLAISTDDGLSAPGSTMGFKVYVVLSTGNERGSNAVSVSRP
ncbi:MAG: hypothetical protein H7Y17_06745 [Chlorobia bacterium]|nr:hypothetical protein [Fimbriimonadaceae bacterium]